MSLVEWLGVASLRMSYFESEDEKGLAMQRAKRRRMPARGTNIALDTELRKNMTNMKN